MLLSSHLLHEVEEVCDSVAILSRGRLIAQGRVKDLLAQRGTAMRTRTTDDAKAAEIIASLTWVSGVSPERKGLTVNAPAERSAEITAVLSEQGVHVSELSQLQGSLEDYFLEVTREDTSPSEGNTG